MKKRETALETMKRWRNTLNAWEVPSDMDLNASPDDRNRMYGAWRALDLAIRRHHVEQRRRATDKSSGGAQ